MSSVGCWHSSFKGLSGLIIGLDAFARIASHISMLASLINPSTGVGKGCSLYTVNGESGFKGMMIASPQGVIYDALGRPHATHGRPTNTKGLVLWRTHRGP